MRFWVQCLGCDDTWVAEFVSEFGFLVPTDHFGETCSDCGSEEIEIMEEYTRGSED